MTHFSLIYFSIYFFGQFLLEMDDSKVKKDPVQSAIGDIGYWQIFICAIIFLLKFPVAWHQMGKF